MDYTIEHGPAFALGVVTLASGESFQAEAGAMVSMSDSIELTTSARGGVFKGLKRSVLGGESFFINTFKANLTGEVTIAPALPGDIVALEVDDQPLLIQSGSFLGATPDVEVDTKWGGAKTFFSREGLFLLRCTGRGTVFVSSYGAIRRIDLHAGEHYTVDTGHMVAFDETVEYSVGKSGGWKATFFSGEGLVAKLTGPGRFYMQTRSPESFVDWLLPQLPSQRS